MNLRKRVVVLLSMIAVALTGTVVTAAPAQAYSYSCRTSNETQVYNSGYVFNPIYYCDNWGTTPLFDQNNSHVGNMWGGSNWVVCWKRRGPNPSTGDGQNNVWLWTKGDNMWGGYNGWAWMPANYVAQGTDWQVPPGVNRECSWA